MSPPRAAVAALSTSTGGYVVAVVLPAALTLAVYWLQWPPFVFEHLVVLLVLAIVVAWDLRQAVVAAIVAVGADNLLLREPIGRAAITGTRDVIDLALFVVVAILISVLVARMQRERRAAQQSELRERRAREELDRLIAAVSHDVSTPLSVLAGTLQFVRKFRSNDPADLERLLVRLEIATARATSLIKTLTDAQAVDGEGLRLNLTAHDLRDVVAPIVHMMDRLSERHPVVLALPDAPVRVVCDADRIQRVVENLLNNAIKYSPDGGAVELSMSVEEGTALLRVRDHGVGISPAALPHIFERSYRAPEAAAVSPGLGLGLSIAAHVVDAHSGTIDVQPARGRGTLVSVRLPMAADDAAAAAHAAGDTHQAVS